MIAPSVSHVPGGFNKSIQYIKRILGGSTMQYTEGEMLDLTRRHSIVYFDISKWSRDYFMLYNTCRRNVTYVSDAVCNGHEYGIRHSCALSRYDIYREDGSPSLQKVQKYFKSAIADYVDYPTTLQENPIAVIPDFRDKRFDASPSEIEYVQHITLDFCVDAYLLPILLANMNSSGVTWDLVQTHNGMHVIVTGVMDDIKKTLCTSLFLASQGDITPHKDMVQQLFKEATAIFDSSYIVHCEAGVQASIEEQLWCP